VRKEEAAARCKLVKEEQLLVLANFPVVALLCLFYHFVVLLHLILRTERYAVHSLQSVVANFSTPVGASHVVDLQCAYESCVYYVRAAARIDQRATAIDRTASSFRDFLP